MYICLQMCIIYVYLLLHDSCFLFYLTRSKKVIGSSCLLLQEPNKHLQVKRITELERKFKKSFLPSLNLLYLVPISSRAEFKSNVTLFLFFFKTGNLIFKKTDAT